jgi:hypothetical protein
VSRERWCVWLERALACALAALFVWRGLVPAWRILNTDFPNYYLAARLFRGGYPLERIYDWVWFQRQKDHAGIDQPLVGYVPLTLFSALVVAPFASLPPLDAKRCWLVVSLLLLGATAYLLRRMTRLAPRRIALMVFLAVVPLRTNFQFGQQYVLVLFLLTLAAWLQSRERSFASGSALAVAAALKIYPAFFVFYFLRKRQWTALGGWLVTSLLLAVLGLLLFGFEPLRVYVVDVLPRSMRGENNGLYTVALNTPAVLLRRLFVAEPELNPHPWLDAPGVFAALQPLVQALLWVPVLWLLTPGRADPGREKLEWASYAAVLVVSSASATYHVCVLILPVALAADPLLQRGWVKRGWLIVFLYALVCAPFYRFVPESPSGWRIFLGFPRLYALAALWLAFLWILRDTRSRADPSQATPPPGEVPRRQPGGDAIALGLLFGVLAIGGWISNLAHARGQTASYAGRVARSHPTLVATLPAVAGEDIYFNRMGPEGSVLDRTGSDLQILAAPGGELFHPTVTEASSDAWVELSSTTSNIVRFPRSAAILSAAELPVEVADAEQPVISPDGRWLGFLRVDRGRGELYVLDRGDAAESQRTAGTRGRHIDGSPHDVLEFAFSPDDRIVLAAAGEGRPRLYAGDADSRRFVELGTSGVPARHPAVSPDGAWLAYDRDEHGAWQLWLMKLPAGEQVRLTDTDCNSTEATWLSDSKNLVYATDCGRALGYTALRRMRAVP